MIKTKTLQEACLAHSHFLAYPAGLTVEKSLKAFLGQKNSFEKATFVVARHPSNDKLFKDWSEVPCIQPVGTVTPMCSGSRYMSRPTISYHNAYPEY
jgi:hypothetical protein